MNHAPLSSPADPRTKRFRRYFLYSWLTNPDGHRNYLRRGYANALVRARQVQPEIFTQPAPHFLLCGVGTVNTAETFCRFALNLAPTARLTLFDVRPEILERSCRHLKRRGLGSAGQIVMQQGEALDFPFAAATFDWVETDNFLQFFPPEQLPRLVAGWQRILKSGGLLTTRQILPNAGLRGQCSGLLWKLYSRLITAPSHQHCVAGFSRLLQTQHFQLADLGGNTWAGSQTYEWAAFKR